MSGRKRRRSHVPNGESDSGAGPGPDPHMAERPPTWLRRLGAGLTIDRILNVVVTAASAIAAIAAWQGVKETRAIAREQQASQRPYFNVVAPGVRDLTDSERFRLKLQLVNIGGRPAADTVGKILIFAPHRLDHVIDLPLSVGNELANGAQYNWFNDTATIPTNAGLHYIVLALRYSDPLFQTTHVQVLVMKWPGWAKDRPFPDFLQVSRSDREKVLGMMRSRLTEFPDSAIPSPR